MDTMPSLGRRINPDAFKDCFTAAEFIERAGGDLRTAETAAWALWEKEGKPQGHPLVGIAIAIAETKWTPKGAKLAD